MVLWEPFYVSRSFVAAGLLLSFAGAPAWADDRSTCYKGTGEHAIAACTRVLAHNPKDADIYYNRGNAYKNQKLQGVGPEMWRDYDRAIADYSQAIRLDPKYAVAYINRGISYEAKGDNDRAIADYDQAIRLDPKDATN
jgi:tetratricopeptide (TPR) repeat protein